MSSRHLRPSGSSDMVNKPGDLTWNGYGWVATQPKGRYRRDNSQSVRLTGLRVLLTRGRDGLLIQVPTDQAVDSTQHSTAGSSVGPLPESLAVGI